MADPLIAETIASILALPPDVNVCLLNLGSDPADLQDQPYTALKGMLPPLEMPDWFYNVLHAK